jgi:predicted NAD/FAD-dependent oxidoreductase
MKIAIIGAGIAGITVGLNLSRKNHDVVIFEKSRGVGGRMSTRYATPYFFDHGAQYFTARSDGFKNFLNPLIKEGVVQAWSGKVIAFDGDSPKADRMWYEPHYTAAPNMNSLCKHLSRELNVISGVEVAPLRDSDRVGKLWILHDKNGESLGEFDFVISTAPAAQTANLLGVSESITSVAAGVIMTGNYTLMAGFPTPWPTPRPAARKNSWIAATIEGESPLGWVALNNTKPGRDSGFTSIVIQSTADWAEQHINEDIPAMQSILIEEFHRIFKNLEGYNLPDAEFLTTHRWRYADVQKPASTIGGIGAATSQPFAMDNKIGLAACGDWFISGRVESAWISAHCLSEAL